MKNTENNSNSIFAKVTNIDVTEYTFEAKKENRIASFDVCETVSTMDMINPYFFRFNVFSGKCTFTRFDFEAMKAVKPFELACEVVRFYYYLVSESIDAFEKKLSEIKLSDMTEIDSVKLQVMNSRIDYVKRVCTKAIASIDVCEASKNIAKVLFGCKVALFSETVKEALKSVMSELQALYTENSEQLPNVKHLREKVTNLNKTLFPIDAKGIIKRNNRKCTDALARDIYARYYKGRRFDAKGKVVSQISTDKDILNETMLACIEAMQLHSVEITPEKSEATEAK